MYCLALAHAWALGKKGAGKVDARRWRQGCSTSRRRPASVQAQ